MWRVGGEMLPLHLCCFHSTLLLFLFLSLAVFLSLCVSLALYTLLFLIFITFSLCQTSLFSLLLPHSRRSRYVRGGAERWQFLWLYPRRPSVLYVGIGWSREPPLDMASPPQTECFVPPTDGPAKRLLCLASPDPDSGAESR